MQGGISNSKKAPGLLSLGRINYQIFCVFYRATEVLNDLTELKGKRIAVGPGGAAGRVVAEKVLAISGISSENSTLLPFTLPIRFVTKALRLVPAGSDRAARRYFRGSAFST